MKKIYIYLFTLLITTVSFGQDLLITGIIDGPLPGGFPKGMELYVLNDIADLSIYGLEIAGNGGPATGVEYTFPADAYTAGDFIYVAIEDADSAAAFEQYLGVTPTYQSSTLAHNGDDTIILYNGATITDSIGEIGVDGTGTAWESLDGWGYRNNGAGPNATFDVTEWSFSGVNALDGCDLADDTGTNAACSSVFPIGTYSPTPSPDTTIVINSPGDGSLIALGTTSVDVVFTTANLGTGDQVDVTVTLNSGAPSTTTDVTTPFTITPTADGESYEVKVEVVNGATVIDFDIINFDIDLILAIDLVINELLADPAADDADTADVVEGDANGDGVRDGSQDEFIEIFNTGSVSIDLENYTISDGYGLRHTFSAGSILPANSFITIFGGGTPTGISGMVQVANEGTTPTLGLNNTGDTVTLKDADGVKRLVNAYGSEGGDNQSIAREPDFTGDFVKHLSHTTNPVAFSPGEKNDGTTLSVVQNQIDGFSIYPNPVTNGSLNMQTLSATTKDITLYNVLGKLVYTNSFSRTNSVIDLSNLNAGIYIIKVVEGTNVATRKLVIQ